MLVSLVESSLVSAMCSGFSVSLCHIDFKNPSFLWDPPASGAFELKNGQNVWVGRQPRNLRCGVRAPDVHDTLRCLVVQLICKHLDKRPLIGAKIFGHLDFEFHS